MKLLSESYNEGKKFLFTGTWIDRNDIREIRIYSTEKPSNEYSGNVFYMSDKEVTRQWINKPPQELLADKEVTRVLSKNVFIVHGKDHKPMIELKTMLKGFGLNPIVLHEKASGSRTIVEKLEKYSNVGYTFVLLNPDDIGSSIVDYKKAQLQFVANLAWALKKNMKGIIEEAMGETFGVKTRARQNVVLEFGYFIGKLGRDKVCCLHKGDVELPSDMHGIVYIPFKESVNNVKDKIVKELKAAGYKINA